MPSSCTLVPAAPSSCLASTMLCVVSGQTVVHCESSNPSITTLPRNWLSDIGWPNWLVSRKSGAATSPIDEPRSRLGLLSAAVLDPAAGLPAVLAEPELHPASAVKAPSTTTAQSAAYARVFFIARPAYPGPRGYY